MDEYNILNVYADLRDPGGKWEVMVYAKNLADTEEVTSREASPDSLSYTFVDASVQGSFGTGGTVTSDYREVELTDPREVGVNLRYSF